MFKQSPVRQKAKHISHFLTGKLPRLGTLKHFCFWGSCGVRYFFFTDADFAKGIGLCKLTFTYFVGESEGREG